MASRDMGKMKSGVPTIPGALTFQPVIPDRTSASRNRTSVVRLPAPLTACMTRDLDGGTRWKQPFGKSRLKSRSMFAE